MFGKTTLGLALTVATLGALSVQAVDEIDYSLTVSALESSSAMKTFEVQNKDHVATITTTPASKYRRLKPGSGQVAASKHHNKVVWREVRDDANMHKAKSPLIPPNQGSWVICIGRFANYTSPGKKNKISYHERNWQSRLLPPGEHVIIVNVYNDPGDVAGSPSFNDFVVGSAKALAEQLAGGGVNAVHLGACGMKRGKITMLPRIGDLAAFVEKEKIEKGKLISLTTLGHGGCLRVLDENGIPKKAENVLKYAVPTKKEKEKEKEKDHVGNAALCDGVLGVDTITKVIGPLFDEDSFVNLDHCYSASKKCTFELNGERYNFSQKKSVARQFKDALPKTVVTGHDGEVSFPLYYDKNNVLVSAPPVSEDGKTTVVLQ